MQFLSVDGGFSPFPKCTVSPTNSCPCYRSRVFSPICGVVDIYLSLQMHVCLECVVFSTHFCLFCNGMYAPQLPPPPRRADCSPSVEYTEAAFSFFVDFVLFTNDLCISLFWA